MDKQRICFLVGSIAISGGTYVIIEHAAYLHDQGYEITLAIQESFIPKTLGWHDRISKLRCVPIEVAKREVFDLVIATWWKTAIELRYFKAPRLAYFVQSIESRFYPETEVTLRALVDATYQIPVAYVTEASWIQDYLKTKYGHDVSLVRNGIRKDIYRPMGNSIALRDPNRMPRVLVEGHFGVSFKNTALGIRLAREAGAKDIWVLTGTQVKWIPGVSKVFSRVPMNITPEIYRSCDILVKLSTVEGMFGPPLEMFHCGGTAIVFDVTGHDEYIIDGQNACVVKNGDMDGVVNTLKRLLNDQSELTRLQSGALMTADRWESWNDASTAFHGWVKMILAKPVVDTKTVVEMCDKMLSDYVRDEKESLSTQFTRSRQHESIVIALIRSIMQRSPFKQLKIAKEVLFVPRIVH